MCGTTYCSMISTVMINLKKIVQTSCRGSKEHSSKMSEFIWHFYSHTNASKCQRVNSTILTNVDTFTQRLRGQWATLGEMPCTEAHQHLETGIKPTTSLPTEAVNPPYSGKDKKTNSQFNPTQFNPQT